MAELFLEGFAPEPATRRSREFALFQPRAKHGAKPVKPAFADPIRSDPAA